MAVIRQPGYTFLGRRFSPADVTALSGRQVSLRIDERNRPIPVNGSLARVLLSYTGGEHVNAWDGRYFSPIPMRNIERVYLYEPQDARPMPPMPDLVRYDFGKTFTAADARAVERRAVQIAWESRRAEYAVGTSLGGLTFDGKDLVFDDGERVLLGSVISVYVAPIGR